MNERWKLIMNLLNLVELLELDNINLIGYASPLKIVAIGKILGFNNDTKVIDLGCGRGDVLNLWGKYFGISGTGVEAYDEFCETAIQKLKDNGLENKINIICADASTYELPKGTYDVASCINASMIWGGFRPTLQKLKSIIKDNGVIIIGEPYYTSKNVPDELRKFEGDFHTEVELLDIIREEGLELMFIKRASLDECDNYRSSFRGDLQRVAIEYMPYYYGSALYVIGKK
jgi:SAM-dependent methyltransferase